jgi:plasmid stabilization system protein ParE
VNYVLTPEAEAELAEAVTFYAMHVGLNVARNFLIKFEEKAQLLTEFPGIGTPTTKGRRLFPIGATLTPCSIASRMVPCASAPSPTTADAPAIGAGAHRHSILG